MGRFTKILRTKGMKKLSSDKEVERKVYRKSNEIFERSKRRLLEDFLNHPVSKEIKAGPEASSSSGAILGAGNLYSFIGFEDGSNPISRVYNLLNMSITLRKGKTTIVKKTKSSVYMGIKINMPTKETLASETKMPWEPGSWLFKIETGISGLGYYIYEKHIKASRSGSGIQIDNKVRPGLFRRQKYMSSMLNKFKRNFINK